MLMFDIFWRENNSVWEVDNANLVADAYCGRCVLDGGGRSV